MPQNQGKFAKLDIPPLIANEPYWVFLVFPQPSFAEYEEYREMRRHLLVEHCQVVKYLHPDALDIIGIAVDPAIERISEDLIYLDARTWFNELNEQAKNLHIQQGFFKNSQKWTRRRSEYPISNRDK